VPKSSQASRFSDQITESLSSSQNNPAETFGSHISQPSPSKPSKLTPISGSSPESAARAQDVEVRQGPDGRPVTTCGGCGDALPRSSSAAENPPNNSRCCLDPGALRRGLITVHSLSLRITSQIMYLNIFICSFSITYF
jgi:hypothetical protein